MQWRSCVPATQTALFLFFCFFTTGVSNIQLAWPPDITHDLAYCNKLTKHQITVFCFKCYIKEQKSSYFSAFTIEMFLFFVILSHWLKEQHNNLFCHFKHLVIKVYVRGPVLIFYLFM